MIPKHSLVKKIQIPPGITPEKEYLVENIPAPLKRWLLKTTFESPGTIQLYFIIKSKRYSFMITAVYFGKHFEIAIQKEDAIVAPFCTVKAFYFGVINTIQNHIDALIEAENAVRAISDNQNTIL